MLGVPAANADAHEIQRMERYLIYGSSYCSGLAAAQYAANVAMARNMSSYLTSVSTTATDPQARVAALRVSRGVFVVPLRLSRKAIAGDRAAAAKAW